MKILFITHLKEKNIDETKKEYTPINDIVCDSTLHGLREIFNEDVIDYPGSWYMYKDEVAKRAFDHSRLWGNGFTYYDTLKEYASIDRTDRKKKIKNNFFQYIIYGSFTRSKLFFEDSLNSKSKIILIDGEDNTDLSNNKNNEIIYFKRELINKKKNIFPINITIPKKKIISQINKSPKNLLAPLIPHRYKTYIYNKENDYYKMWQNSLFGITYVYGGWWEAVRYYEMLMNGCVPLILNLNKCPELTLTKLPKKELIDIFENYSWILNKYNPLKIYKKKFLDIDKFLQYLIYLPKKNYTSETFIKEFPEINDIRLNLLNHTKNYLTTEHNAKYIIETTDKFYIRN